MHPLTKLIYPYQGDGNWKEQTDTIITTYLKGRLEWLKNETNTFGYAYKLRIAERAFELDEKCEQFCECESPLILNNWPQYKHISKYHCGRCGHWIKDDDLKEPKPTLPSKINISEGSYGEMRAINTLNQLIDYLHSKEAR